MTNNKSTQSNTQSKFFKLPYNMDGNSCTTLFKHRYFNFPIKEYNGLGRNKEHCLGSYTLFVAKDVKEKYAEDGFISEILNMIDKDKVQIRIFTSPYKRGGKKGEVVRCAIDYIFLQQIKKLFVSTLAYLYAKKDVPEMESMEFTFDYSDLEARTVSLSSLNLYTPLDNPFFEYARNYASFLSFEDISSGKLKTQDDSERNDFYKPELLSPWKTADNIDKDKSYLLDIPGIYMLYNSNNNNFYIGKSKNLLQRIKKHYADENDPSYGFTHYRYSIIQSEYFDVLDLIENAAIHDVAWILNMPESKRYKKALSTFADINNCIMTNKIERQTKK